MAQFEEVLKGVQLALTWASAAEIQALLEGLVEERIISEAYGKSLSLHRLAEGIAPAACKPGSDYLMGSQGSTTQWHLNQGSQVSKCGPSMSRDHNQTRSESVWSMDEHDNIVSRPLYEVVHENSVIEELRGGPVMDEHYLNHKLSSTQICDYQCGLTLDNEIAELLRSAELMQKPVSDNESVDEGNSEDEKEWLEQVEQAARRIALPLWQHWDRGRRMLLPLVPCMTAGRATSEKTGTESEAHCPLLNMEEEAELAIACRTLDLYADVFTELEVTDPNFTLDSEGAPRGLHFSTGDRAATIGLNTDNWYTCEARRNASPVQACAAANDSITDRLGGDLDAFWMADSTTDTTEDLLCLMGDVQSGAGFAEDIAHLFSPCTPTDTHTDAQDYSFYSDTDHSMTLGVMDSVENVFRAAYGTRTCSADGKADFHKNKEDEERMDSLWGAKMQEVDQDPLISSFWGDLPDECLTEILNDDDELWKFLDESLGKCLDHEDMLFDESFWNCENGLSTCCDLPRAPELPSPDSHQLGQEDKVTGNTNTRRKRARVPRSQQCTDESTPSRPKRQRAAGRQKTKEAQAKPTVTQGSEPSPAETPADPSTTPPRILHLHPSIQFITIPDTPGYQVIRLPLPNTAATPTYILVPAASPPFKQQVPPLSPTNGAVAPVQMSSSPTGTLSDTASKAGVPPWASPLSPSNEISTSKESPLPQSPTVLDTPQVVKDYIQEAKAHMSQTCQDMGSGLSLTSHYVDVQVSRREVLRSGKNTNKVLDKELVIMGDTDRQKSLLEQSQIFEGSNGDKPKSYILLLGNAGMGKSTLIRKLCLDWSKDCFPQFDFVFFLDGNALSSTEATFSLQTLLLNLSSFAPPCMDPGAVYAQILAAPKRVLVIFDGFGELRDLEILLQTQEKDLVTSLLKDSKAQSYTVKQLYSGILQRLLLPGCTLLLSTRPRGTASQLLRRTDSLLEVCGFNPANVETYLSQYFTDPDLRAPALDCLKNCSYLRLLCWNPGLCRLVCLVLEQCKSSEALPRTLTGLCHQVLRLTMEKDSKSSPSQDETQSEVSVQSEEETQTQISNSSQVSRRRKTSRAPVHTGSRTRRARGSKRQELEEDDVDGDVDRTKERELLSQLSSLAWEGVKANSSILPTGRTISAKLRAFGHRTGLFFSYHLKTRSVVSSGEREGGGREDIEETGTGEKGQKRGNKGRTDNKKAQTGDDHILLWANPFLQSYLAGVHLSLSKTVTDRAFLQTLPFQSSQKGRRRPQREELELTQQFAAGLLFHNRTELPRLHSCTETAFRDMVAAKQALVTKHLEGLSHGDLSPAQVLEACHYVYEASSTRGDGNRDCGSARLVAHLAANLPEVLTFNGVPLKPSDVFAVQNVLERGGAEGRRFCLDLEDSGIQILGLRTLVGLNNINTYRACIADVITLWEQLEQSGEEGLLQGSVSKFKIHPLKATQVCHIEHLAKLVNIHTHKRLSDSSSQSDSILAEGVPAVRELHKLELGLGPEKGPLVLPKLWELLPGLHDLQHLDLENSKIGDKGAEKLADVLVSLGSLEILNLSQNCIGDQGVKNLATMLRDLPKLHCLSLYSNVISDEGAETLAAVLPHMASLTDLDVKYNKLTDVGAHSLGASLRNCSQMKTLRMWNQCIPYGVFERLQQQDNRIRSQ
ncbi:MHC class II transactivator isoform X1 [Sebastes umbrosus]|uniref:MHC class II transactivator isoform X1 n=2 Tax=Sebastes umbrosus TaxID=72105 RepID=UPI0018A0D3D2|nr:MHC class II transactivator isoform X1 [Sebastes umbrosus]